MSSFRCHQCKNRVVQKSDDGTHVRSHGALTFDEHGICHAKCFFCKSQIVLPLELVKAGLDEGPKLVVVDVARRPIVKATK